MRFKVDDEYPWWIAEHEFNGYSIHVKLEIDDEDETDVARVGQRVVDHVQSNWALIQRSLVEQLLDVHNQEWADSARGRPQLSAKEFLELLRPTSIDFGTWEDDDRIRESCGMYFDDANLFGGHVIQILWDYSESTIDPSVSIEG